MKPPVTPFVHLLVGLLVAILGATESVRGVSATRLEPAPAQGAPQKDAQPAPKKDPLLKLAQPWPSADEMRRAKADAETRPLFATPDPLSFTLAGDFKTINEDHDPNSTKRYPAELRVTREDGEVEVIPVNLRARGHVRRMAAACEFVPLRVEFKKARTKGTLFEGQSALKLVVQCKTGGIYGQYLLREYTAYRTLNLLTPRSLRARFSKVTYVDSGTERVIGTRYGMFLEDDDDVARRMEGRAVQLQRVLFKDVDAETLETMTIFEYLIGNTDFSLFSRHNVILVQTPDLLLYPIPYDFDYSGYVNPPYASPARTLSIKTVDERLFRGPCRPVDQVDSALKNFKAKRDAVLGLPDLVPDVDKQTRQEVKTFLDGFYSAIKNPKDVRRLFVDGACSKVREE
jgi:hypothetical protein